MSINGISGSSHSINTSAGKSKADESIQQLAAEGDPIAIAELKAEDPQQEPSQQVAHRNRARVSRLISTSKNR